VRVHSAITGARLHSVSLAQSQPDCSTIPFSGKTCAVPNLLWNAVDKSHTLPFVTSPHSLGRSTKQQLFVKSRLQTTNHKLEGRELMCGFRAHSSSGRRACRLEAGGQLDGHVSCARVRIKKAGDDLTVRSNFAFRETASHAIFVKDPKSQKTKQNERKQLTGALRIITTSERVFYATIPLLRLRHGTVKSRR